MKAIGVIPARRGSTRLPNKPLIKIAGRELVLRVADKVSKCAKLSEVIVATDDQEIGELVERHGFKAQLTSPDLQSGTDRVFEALKGLSYDLVVNIQGDEPLIRPHWIDQLVESLKVSNAEMATLGHSLSSEELHSLDSVKVVVNEAAEALYFSRFPIPYSRVKFEKLSGPAYKHVGLYAYRFEFLKRFCLQKPVALEQAESLEQLRALYMGAKIKVILVEGKSIGVDTYEDVRQVEEILKNEN